MAEKPSGSSAPLINDPAHRDWLRRDARRQLDIFRASLRDDGGFDVLDPRGQALTGQPQELHTTARLVHSFALGHLAGAPDCWPIIDAGIAALRERHRDPPHGGYAWSITGRGIADGTKLAYGQVFVLLAAATATEAGHPDAPALLADAAAVIDRHFWDEDAGLLRDEFARDWTVFSTYRGLNANMHGVEAMLAAHEATGDALWLSRAGRVLDFFVNRIAPQHGDRMPEHYHQNWTVDHDYSGNLMFRPPGSTPGHSFELARLLIQHWDLAGRSDARALTRARALIRQAHRDAWRADGGYVYTLDRYGTPAIRDRYWWPVTEAIGAVAALLKLEDAPEADTSKDDALYRRLWRFAQSHFIDAEHGGWYPEIDEAGRPMARQFMGKPDIYHAFQAALFPALPGVSRLAQQARRTRFLADQG